MVEHVYYILTGRKVAAAAQGSRRSALRRQAPGLSGTAPRDRDDRRSIRARPASISRTSSRIGSSPTSTGPTAWHRRRRSGAPGGTRRLGPGADAGAGAARTKSRRGLRQAVGPTARSRSAMLYGGIDSQGSDRTRRRPQRRHGRDPAHDGERCRLQACRCATFARQPEERRSFPDIEPDVLPGHSAKPTHRSAEPSSICTSCAGQARCRRFSRMSSEHSHLFAGIVRDAQGRKRESKSLNLIPAGHRRTRRSPRIRITRSAPGAAWSPICFATRNSFTSKRLCSHARLSEALRPRRSWVRRPIWR